MEHVAHKSYMEDSKLKQICDKCKKEFQGNTNLCEECWYERYPSGERLWIKTLVGDVLVDIVERFECANYPLWNDDYFGSNKWAKVPVLKWDKENEVQEYEYYPLLNRNLIRMCFRLEIDEHNKIDFKHNHLDSIVTVKVFLNNVQVDSFSRRYMDSALFSARNSISRIKNCHHFNWSDPKSEIGRKIWWREQPGIIKSVYPEQQSVIIDYDGDGEGFNMYRAYYTKEDMSMEEGEYSNYVKDSIFSHDIWWWRK